MAGPLEQAAGNHAAVSAFAVDGDGTVSLNRGESAGKGVESAAQYLGNMTGLPFAFATHVENVVGTPGSGVKFLIQFLWRNLRCLRSRAFQRFCQAGIPPARYPRSSSMPTRARRSRASSTVFRRICRSRLGSSGCLEFRRPRRRIVQRARCRSIRVCARRRSFLRGERRATLMLGSCRNKRFEFGRRKRRKRWQFA